MKTNREEIVLGVEELITLSLTHRLSCENEFTPTPAFFDKKADKLLPDGGPVMLSHTFTQNDCRFTLNGTAHRITEDGLFLILPVTKKDLVYKENIPVAPVTYKKRRGRGIAFLLAYLWALENGAEASPTIHTIYVATDADAFVKETETPTKEALSSFFARAFGALQGYAAHLTERAESRLPSMAALRFPFPEKRMGQGELMQAVYKTVRRGGQLYASAPTGIGKTMSVLYPAVRALGEGHVEKIFYLTPKTTVAQAAADAVLHLSEQGAHIRAVRLYAKEALCPSDGACRENVSACPRFFRTKNGCEKAANELFKLNLPVVDATTLCRVANKHRICPHELALCYSEFADVIICDYNYLFDPDIALKRYFLAEGEYVFLIDEAHNLPDRAREMYSATLTLGNLEELYAFCLENNLCLSDKTKECVAVFKSQTLSFLEDSIHEAPDGTRYGYVRRQSLPDGICSLIQEVVEAASQELRLSPPIQRRLRRLILPLQRLASKAAAYDEDCVSLFSVEGENIALCLFCVNPASRLTDRMGRGRATVLFSATMEPLHYYKSVLGADRTAAELSLPSPFPEENLGIAVMDGISLRYADRQSTLPDICRAVTETVRAHRGNYLIFCPSFAYLDALADLFEKQSTDLTVIRQTPGMSRTDRTAFLAKFIPTTPLPIVGFAVMGGMFSESVDLTGERLVGSVVIGVGLPGPSKEREACAAYYNERCDSGREYAYLYPGINRVLQAAGRVIRTENDRGILVLIDDRFRDPFYRAMIPNHYRHLRFVGNTRTLAELLRRFWNEKSLLPKGSPAQTK